METKYAEGGETMRHRCNTLGRDRKWTLRREVSNQNKTGNTENNKSMTAEGDGTKFNVGMNVRKFIRYNPTSQLEGFRCVQHPVLTLGESQAVRPC